ncbi:flavonoid 3'-monooxygenase [Selaginella moellendorffii]|nr:flavonoid 3'-monooxygenase [Selaginella moellendorffii]|eukprot:XP_002976098.2 flavonoid 3'-monooxygenase [Selaginella moellendorffii]
MFWIGWLCVAAAGALLASLGNVYRHWQKLPPGPWGWPIVGCLFCVSRRNLHRSFAELATKYGPIVYLNMGSRATVVISSPEVARAVFREHDVQFASRPRYSTPFKHISQNFKDLVFAPYGGRWKNLRKICSTELFTASKVNMFGGIRKAELHDFCNNIAMRAAAGEEVNLSVCFQELLTNLMSSVLFGKKFYTSDLPPVAEAAAYRATWGMLTQESGKIYLGDYIPALHWLDRLRGKDQRIRKTIIPALQGLLNSVIEERRKQLRRDKPRDFVDVMVALNDQKSLSNDEIVAIIQDMLLAGTGTTRSTLEWGFSELVRHPEVQRRAQEELDRVVGRERYVQESDLSGLPYIQALVKEIMRLHPAAPLGLPHFNSCPVSLAGYTIPANSTLHVNIWAICRDPSSWERAHEFRPERFLGSCHNLLGQHFELIPFSSGRRRCAGINLALLHVSLTLAYLLHRFEWRPPPGVDVSEIDMSETTGLACFRTVPLRVSVRPRLELS